MHEVHPYSIDTLRLILSQRSGAPEDIVSSKLHRHYFQGYFQEIGAKTIVVEEGYTDRDFLSTGPARGTAAPAAGVQAQQFRARSKAEQYNITRNVLIFGCGMTIIRSYPLVITPLGIVSQAPASTCGGVPFCSSG